ncbi:Transglycosylase SLT domain protein [uncultured Desulfobacterium sp.]|uniref:Transglycosylase SLT domain protein n=1 Tax=uncultured Desulfobacterium sp. TaxID=201089 RepID=A0A445MVW4_9BACT|nr:Transglycosylase SLT domain protein [uncultured Desulfobacterium sp.]
MNRICIFAISIACCLIFCTSSSAEIYRYVDKNGVWHFSNIKSNKHYEVFLTEKSRAYLVTGNMWTNKYDDIIHHVSRLFQVESGLIKAIIKAESNFDHRALSKKGAQGLMQLMPETAYDMNVKDPYDPKQNIFGGTRYISMLLKRFNYNKTLALAAYNAGPEEVESRNSIPPFPETQTFIKRVLDYYSAYNGASF